MPGPTSPISNHLDQLPPAESQKASEPSKNWLGRTSAAIGSTTCCVAGKISSSTQVVIKNAAALTEDVTPVCAIFRKTKPVTDLWEKLAGIPGFFKKFRSATTVAVGGMDAIQVVGDISYFVNKGYIKTDSNGEIIRDAKGNPVEDSKIFKAGRVGILAADATGTALWLEAMGFYKLGNIAAKLSEVRVFSFVPKVISSIPVLKSYAGLQSIAAKIGQLRVFSVLTKITMSLVCATTLAAGYALLAADAIYKLAVKAREKCEKVAAGLDSAYYVSEVALGVMIMAGVTNVVGLGIVAASSIALCITSFLYKFNHKKELEKAQIAATKTMTA